MLRMCSKQAYIILLGIALFSLGLLMILWQKKDRDDICGVNYNGAPWISRELDDKVILRWNVEGKDIVIKMEAETQGWIGLGFKPEATLKGSDFVRGWISKQIYLEDRHFISNDVAAMDDKRDYKIIGGKRNSTHTALCFKRKLDTCDEKDVKIKKGSVPVFWITGDKNPEDFYSETTSIDSLQVKTKLIDFQNKKYPEDKSTEVKTIEFRIKEWTISTEKESIYRCQIFSIPKLSEKHSIIGYEPLLSSKENIIHHILVQACVLPGNLTDTEGEECFTNGNWIKWKVCNKFIAVWTSGTPLGTEFIPSDVAYDFEASTQKETRYLQITMHYYNPQNKTGVKDSSGMRFYLTSKQRKYKAGTFMITHSTGLAQVIPPKQPNFPTTAICINECLQQSFPPEGIHVFAIRPHAHLMGRKLYFRHFRNGVELEPIGNEHFDYSDEHTMYLEPERIILPNDILAFDCYYDSMNKTETSFGGSETTAEMCQTYVMYYPLIELSVCHSHLPLTSTLNIIGAKEWGKSGRIQIPESVNNISTKAYLTTYKWTNDEVEQLRNLYLYGEQKASCLWNNGTVYAQKQTTHPRGFFTEESDCN